MWNNLKKSINKKFNELLNEAVIRGDLAGCKKAVFMGADINNTLYTHTPLSLAAAKGHVFLFEYFASCWCQAQRHYSSF